MRFGGHPRPQRLIDALEVQIGNARVVLAHEGDHVAAAIGVMTGVQHDGDQLRVGRAKKRLDLVLMFDVGLGMGVENQLQAIVVAGDAGNAMGGVNQPGKGRLVQAGRGKSARR